MSRFSLIVSLIILVFGTSVWGQSGHFNITGTEPVEQGDTITIVNSENFSALHSIIGASYKFYYNGIGFTPEHPVPDGMWDLSFDSQYRITGTTQLDIGEYTWATEVQVDVNMVYLAQIRHFYSRNLLGLSPTTYYVPAASTWSIIALLGLFGVLLIRRGR